jgi:N-acyl-D-amino-acid deacylase
MGEGAKFVIAGANVTDGTGEPPKQADIHVDGVWISGVRPSSDHHPGSQVVDARGLTLAPGFIDVHSHADNAPLLDVDATEKILQGVTTEVVGNCGFSLAPAREAHRNELLELLRPLMPPFAVKWSTMRELFAVTDRRGYVTNYAPLIGHSTLRAAVMGNAMRAPTPAELASMQSAVDEALEAGAFGLSTGLIYPPGAYAQTDEIIELARRLPRHAIYTSHIRGEGSHLLSSVAEAIEIAERSGTRLQISHHKAAGKSNWGKTKETLQMIDAARGRGAGIHQDVYPYTAGSTYLKSLLPPEYLAGSVETVLARLKDAAELANLERRLANDTTGFENFVVNAGYDGIRISSTASHRFEGQTLAEIAAGLGCTPFQALIDILASERLEATMILFMLDESDIVRVLRNEFTVIGSDGAPPGLKGKHHPRTYGTFPRIISRYVREQSALSLETAVWKMTGLPARIFNIPDRGTIAAGKIADLVAFDAATIGDDLDYDDPARPPHGIAWVMLGGTRVVENQTYTGRRNGVRLKPR